MRIVALVLVCMASVGHGFRAGVHEPLRTSVAMLDNKAPCSMTEKLQSKVRDGEHVPRQALASFLFACNPVTRLNLPVGVHSVGRSNAISPQDPRRIGHPIAMNVPRIARQPIFANAPRIAGHPIAMNVPSRSNISMNVARRDALNDELAALKGAYKLPIDFPLHFSDTVDALKIAIPQLLEKEPDWDVFAKSFEVADHTGAKLQGLKRTKLLSILLRRMRRKYIVSSNIWVEEDVQIDSTSTVPIAYLVAQGKVTFDAAPTLVPWRIGLPIEVEVKAHFYLNERNQLNRIQVVQLLVNGKNAIMAIFGWPKIELNGNFRKDLESVKTWIRDLGQEVNSQNVDVPLEQRDLLSELARVAKESEKRQEIAKENEAEQRWMKSVEEENDDDLEFEKQQWAKTMKAFEGRKGRSSGFSHERFDGTDEERFNRDETRGAAKDTNQNSGGEDASNKKSDDSQGENQGSAKEDDEEDWAAVRDRFMSTKKKRDW